MFLSTYFLEYGQHVRQLRHCCRAYMPTCNTASHDNHEKINFSFLYEYGGHLAWSQSSAIRRKHLCIMPLTLIVSCTVYAVDFTSLNGVVIILLTLLGTTQKALWKTNTGRGGEGSLLCLSLTVTRTGENVKILLCEEHSGKVYFQNSGWQR